MQLEAVLTQLIDD